MKKNVTGSICCFFFAFSLSAVAQKTAVDGYLYETNNRGFLNQVKVSIRAIEAEAVVAEAQSDSEGHFVVQLPPGNYELTCRKDIFKTLTDTFAVADQRVFLKLAMSRQPGYLFDATLAESRTDDNMIVDAIEGAQIDIYNRTAKKVELELPNHPAFFQFTFIPGNHYTIMIRKRGFLTKRIEAYVNVKGCIICLDGVKELNPGVAENLTANNSMGTLLANIELERARLDKRIAVDNIFYDLGKTDARPEAAKELDKIVTLMRDNPGMTVELGSHTDARGTAAQNLELSQKRAERAVDYIIEKGIDGRRISAKGYGKSKLKNRCADGVECTEAEHQQNRRTELRILSLGKADETWTPLEAIIRDEEFDQAVKALENQKVVKIADPNAPLTPPADPKQAAPANKVPVPAKPASTAGKQPAPAKPGTAPAAKPATAKPTVPATATTDQPSPSAKPATVTPPKQPTATAPSATAAPKPEPAVVLKPPVERPVVPAPAAPRTGTKTIPYGLTGYTVEFLKTENPLPEGDALSNTFRDIYFWRDEFGHCCYFTGLFDKLEKAQAFCNNEVKSKFPLAKVAVFTKGVKQYVN